MNRIYRMENALHQPENFTILWWSLKRCFILFILSILSKLPPLLVFICMVTAKTPRAVFHLRPSAVKLS